jgi:peptidoglycan hydrolase-like protein with peptidoglycan-binding domain
MSPDTDFAASVRRSQERRTAATRRRRRRLRGRTLAIVATISMTAISGVALAAGTGSSAAPTTHTATLSVGSSGPAVKQLQRKLGVSATGYYGPQTKSAVKRFQRSHRLAADGVAGPATLRALGIRVTSASYTNGGTAPTSGGPSTRVPAVLEKIAQCESGGNPHAVSAGGRYRGKYQFDRATWERWGGTGDPAKAAESTQDRVALRLYKARGTAPWPNCA